MVGEASGAVEGDSTPADQVPDAPPAGAVDPAKDRRIGEAIRRARLSTVTLVYEAGSQRRVASGVVINDQGEILSIRIDPPADRARASILVSDSSGRRYQARWLGIDPDTGLTLLRVDMAQLKPIRQAAGDPSLGADIFLIGNPFGLGHSVSRGHIAGLGRRLTLGSQTLGGLIQIQATLHPGDSGALLADLDGGWLGLVRGSLAAPGLDAGRDNDLGFAIPARDALWVADRLRSTGRVDRAYLGLRFASTGEAERELPPPLAGANPVPPVELPPDQVGATVTGVIAGSPAERSGLRSGDRVTQIDDRPVNVADDLTDRLERTAAGADLALEFFRGTDRNRVTVRATSRPVPPAVVEPVAPVATLNNPPTPRPVLTPRTDESALVLIRSLRDQLDRLERRVEQLERENRARKSASNP